MNIIKMRFNVVRIVKKGYNNLNKLFVTVVEMFFLLNLIKELKDRH